MHAMPARVPESARTRETHSHYVYPVYENFLAQKMEISHVRGSIQKIARQLWTHTSGSVWPIVSFRLSHLS